MAFYKGTKVMWGGSGHPPHGVSKNTVYIVDNFVDLSNIMVVTSYGTITGRHLVQLKLLGNRVTSYIPVSMLNKV